MGQIIELNFTIVNQGIMIELLNDINGTNLIDLRNEILSNITMNKNNIQLNMDRIIENLQEINNNQNQITSLNNMVNTNTMSIQSINSVQTTQTSLISLNTQNINSNSNNFNNFMRRDIESSQQDFVFGSGVVSIGETCCSSSSIAIDSTVNALDTTIQVSGDQRNILIDNLQLGVNNENCCTFAAFHTNPYLITFRHFCYCTPL